MAPVLDLCPVRGTHAYVYGAAICQYHNWHGCPRGLDPVVVSRYVPLQRGCAAETQVSRLDCFCHLRGGSRSRIPARNTFSRRFPHKRQGLGLLLDVCRRHCSGSGILGTASLLFVSDVAPDLECQLSSEPMGFPGLSCPWLAS